MATCKNLIDGALRKLGVLASGRSATDQEYEDCMDTLRGVYNNWITGGTFGSLREVTSTADSYTAFPGEHIYRFAGQEINLPDQIPYDPYIRGDDYGWGPRGVITQQTNNQISPPDGSVVRISDNDSGNTATWVFDGQIKNWTAIEDLLLNDEAPLSTRDVNGFKAYLAILFAEEFAMEVGSIAQLQARQFTHNLAVRPASYKLNVRKDYI